MTSIRGFFTELRRRRVFRTIGMYIVGAWVVLQVIALAFQSFGIPDTAMRFAWILVGAGFPLALVFAWRFDITAVGIVRTQAASSAEAADLSLRTPDYLVLVGMAVMATFFAGGVINEIRQVPSDTSGPWFNTSRLTTTLAVLPLVNLSGDSGQDFLAAGLHDALIATLSKITALRVTSRTSVRRINDAISIQEMGERLGVENVIEGSVTREGDRVRVIVQLRNAQTDEPIWAESFEREFDGLLTLQNELASAVAREVKVQLTPYEQEALSTVNEKENATYETYLRGMFQLRKGSRKGYRRGIEILTEAVENNPTSALAYAGLAYGYGQLGHSPYPVDGAYPRAREAAKRALQYDPNLAEAHLAIGMYKIYYEWDFIGGEEAFLRAMELNPSLVDAHYHYAWLLELLFRDKEALMHGELTKELNPLSPFYSSWLADQYRDAGMYDQAIAEAQTVLGFGGDYPVAWLILGYTYADMGDFDKAIEAHEHLRDNYFWSFALVCTLAQAGETEKAVELKAAVEKRGANPFAMSLIYASFGEDEAAIDALRAAKEQHIPWSPWLATWFPQTRHLQADPRVQELAAEFKIPVIGESASR